MRAGALKELIYILRKTSVSDGMGGTTETWAVNATVRAQVTVSQSGAFIDAGGQAAPVISHIVRTRGDVDIRTSDRIYWENRLLDIVDVSPTRTRPPQQKAICKVRVGESFTLPA